MKIRSQSMVKKKRSLALNLKHWPHVITGFAAIVTFLLGSILFSYSPYDESWFYYSSEYFLIHNIAGSLGAHIAALCFFILGNGSYLLIGFGIYLTYCFARKRSLFEEFDRGLAFIFMIPTWSAILYGFKWGGIAYLVPGGQLGKYVYELINDQISSTGSLFFLYGLLMCQFILISRISFIEVLIAVKNFFIFGLKVKKNIYNFFIFTFKKIILFLPWFFLKFRYYVEKIESILYKIVLNYDKIQDLNNVNQESSDLRIVTEKTVHNYEKQTQDKVILESFKKQKSFTLPSASLFLKSEKGHQMMSAQEIKKMALVLEEKLARFGISGTVIDVKQGPIVTLFEYQPAIETKLSKIISLDQDLALALQAMSVRIVAPIPGTARVGFEVSNKERASVLFGDLIQSNAFQKTKAILPLVLGKDTAGNPVVVDLADMPHLLVAGSTGSGKSIALNTMIISLISSLTPQQLSLIIIDPKRLEFSAYQDIPHLLFPIITDPHRAAPVLRWLVKMMEERYQIMAELAVRNIREYKAFCQKEQMIDVLPYTVVLIDELADLMMVAGKESEQAIVRLAQMARAAGIHLIVATQRPSVDVITGLIKVNFPSRISFRLTSKIDSRTILDTSGAQALLGKGDMLFMDVQSSRICRVHGAYVSDVEIKRVTDMVRSQQKPDYKDLQEAIAECQPQYGQLADDPLLKDVLIFLNTVTEISISLLQRRFKVGYNRSARLIELLEQQGKIMPADGSKMRKVVK